VINPQGMSSEPILQRETGQIIPINTVIVWLRYPSLPKFSDRKVQMSEQEFHEMVLDKVLPMGAEEWYCPTCGRRFLMQWPPTYSKVILNAGDETAIHSGCKGSLTLSGPKVAQAEQAALSKGEQEMLSPWLDWMEKSDFEALWNRPIDVEG
jgi:hypothetical protein